MDLAQCLRDARKRAGKSQAEIAVVLGTTQQQYAKYETGMRELPVHHLVTLADLYELTLDELVGRNFQKRQR